jgi:FtsH-binding integral membrane protein
MNQDLKGIIYLVGLLFACFLNSTIGYSIMSFFPTNNPVDIKVCNTLSFGGNYNDMMPLGQCILSYSFFSLVYVIASLGIAAKNIGTLILFPILIISDFIWNVMNNCYDSSKLVISLLIGAAVGVAWSAIIYSLKKPYLQFYSFMTNDEICSRPSRQVFKCTKSSGSSSNTNIIAPKIQNIKNNM